jgi:hypothetical protein
MTEPKSNDEALDILNREGTGYAVQHYCSSEVFFDAKTRELWKVAGDALGALERHLEDATGRKLS